MMTLSRTAMRTNYMIEQIRINAINETFEQWKEATRRYYEHGYDNGETTKLYRELEKLGMDMEVVFDTDYEIREEVFNK